jgi:hypothetical protein
MISAAAFTLFCVVCSLFAFTRHPIWGLYFYLGTTYVFPPGRWWGYLFGDLRWALIAAAITTLAVVFHRGKLKPKPPWMANAPVVLLTLYAAWMGVQTLWALDLTDHVKGTTDFVKNLLALWFVYRTLDSLERVRDLMFGHVLGCGLLGVYARMQGREGGRLDGVGGPNIDDSNTLGMVLVTGAVCALGLVFTQTGWRRWASLVSLPLIINGFVLANSRGAFLGLVAGVLVLFYCMAKAHRWMFYAMGLAGVVGLSIIVDRVFIERMFTIQDVSSQDEDADTSARSRVVIAKAQLEMFLDHPMGSGWRGTAALSPQYMEQRWLTGDADTAERASHNTYLTALAEQGIPGALLYSTLVIWVFVAIVRVRRMNRRKGHDPTLVTLGAALCGALMVVLVAGTTADYLTKEVQFWLYAALVSVFWLGESDRQPNQPVARGEPSPAKRAATVPG